MFYLCNQVKMTNPSSTLVRKEQKLKELSSFFGKENILFGDIFHSFSLLTEKEILRIHTLYKRKNLELKDQSDKCIQYIFDLHIIERESIVEQDEINNK